MTLERFRQLLGAYGSALDRFPENEQAAARTLLDTSEEARTLVQAEASLDAHFEAYVMPEISSSLERRLNEIPARASSRSAPPLVGWWRPVLGWSLAAILGCVMGATSMVDGLVGEDFLSTEEPDDVEWTATEEGFLVEMEVEE